MKTECPHCTQSVEADDEMSGMSVPCPTCGVEFTLSQPTPPLLLPPIISPPPIIPTLSGGSPSPFRRVTALGQKCYSTVRNWPLRNRLMLGGGAFLLLAMLGTKLLIAAPLPPHVVRLSDGALVPDVGYIWLSEDKGDRRVVWSPGFKHPQHGHVFAAGSEGKWSKEDGYEWVTTNNSDFRVVWAPGMKHPEKPHVRAHSDEGYWTTEPGYEFLEPSSSLNTRWTSGLTHPTRPHVVASAKEGVWLPANGYRWVNEKAADDWRVVAVNSRRSSRGEPRSPEDVLVAALDMFFSGNGSAGQSGWLGGGQSSGGAENDGYDEARQRRYIQEYEARRAEESRRAVEDASYQEYMNRMTTPEYQSWGH